MAERHENGDVVNENAGTDAHADLWVGGWEGLSLSVKRTGRSRTGAALSTQFLGLREYV